MATKPKQSTALAMTEDIDDKIYVIRGQRVMVDSDLAKVYQVETRVLNQAVNRNRSRFPKDFIFQLTKEEFDSLISQTVRSKPGGDWRTVTRAISRHFGRKPGVVTRNEIITNRDI